MRPIATAALDEIALGAIAVRHAVYFEVGSGYGLWDDIYDVTIAGRVYSGRASRFTMTPFASVSDGSVQALDVVFGGVDPTVFAFLTAEDWHQRPMQALRVLMRPSTLEILDASVWFSGFIDEAPVEEADDGVTSLTVRCESIARDLERAGTATRSEASQRRIAADDGFFKHSAVMRTLRMWWGQKPPATAEGSKRWTGGDFGSGGLPKL